MQRNRTRRALSLAMALGTLGAAAVAGPAAAVPIDNVLLQAGNTDFGNNWVAGVPQTPGILDWNDAACATPTPQVQGTLYLNNSPGVQARVQMVVYDAAHVPIATANSALRTGGAGLSAFPVNLSGITSTGRHVHVNLRDNRSGSMQTVATAIHNC